jgi:hypothetical protein
MNGTPRSDASIEIKRRVGDPGRGLLSGDREGDGDYWDDDADNKEHSTFYCIDVCAVHLRQYKMLIMTFLLAASCLPRKDNR